MSTATSAGRKINDSNLTDEEKDKFVAYVIRDKVAESVMVCRNDVGLRNLLSELENGIFLHLCLFYLKPFILLNY